MAPADRSQPAADGGAPEPVRLEKARDILHTLANTVSAMKIFPSDHSTVRHFVDTLDQKFKEFLAPYQKLQVGIEEYSFTHAGRPVYTDELTIKSLPFFFFKDGLHILYFYQGLDKQEISDFMELIKVESQKPPEDSDIVAALWERDFPNIQYYAPDEYLENRILAESHDARSVQTVPDLPAELDHETIEVRIDTSKLSQGRIELSPEDREEARIGALGTDAESRTGPEASPQADAARDTAAPREAARKSPAAAMDPTFSAGELQELETLVRTNRTMSPEEEFINLMVELIFLESDAGSCRTSLDVLVAYHLERLERGDFQTAVLIIAKVQELRDHLKAGDGDKAALLDSFLNKIVSAKTFDAVKTLLEKKQAVNWAALLDFFKLLGPPALALAADLFEIVASGEARHKILELLREHGSLDPGLLARLADSTRPGLSNEIVGILAGLPDNRGVAHLASFVSFQNRDVRMTAIQALGRTRQEVANRILMGFLNDPDEELRIQAAMKLSPIEETSRIQHFVREASSREFRAKSLKEKEAVLAFLGRTRSPAALEFLSRTLFRSALFPSRQALEMRIAAVSGLESMGTAEAARALEKGALGRTKRIREACAAALIRMPPAGA